MKRCLISSPSPVWSSDDSYIRPVTFWVVGDFDSPSGRQLLYDAIRHMVQSFYTPNFYEGLCTCWSMEARFRSKAPE